MEELIDLRIKDFLDATARRCPTPGGGAVAATAGALACSMARMVAAFSVTKKTEAEKSDRVAVFADRFARADALMRGLIQEDATVYAAMTQAAKDAKEDPAKTPELAEAVFAAIRVPMQMVAVASNLLIGLDEFKPDSSRYLLSDLGVAAVLAAASARAAYYSIRVNLGSVDNETMRGNILAEAGMTLRHCETHCESVEKYVREQLPTE